MGKASQTLNKELQSYWESEKHADTYQRLGSISNEEYQAEVARLLGADQFDDIKGLFEPLRTRNAQAPERAVRPIIAKLLVLEAELETGAKKYTELLNENKLIELEKFVAEELKPKLLMQVYLKHCIIDPTRPELGQLSKDGNHYHSLTSHLYGQLSQQLSAQDQEGLRGIIGLHTERKPSEVKFPKVEFDMNELHPDAISREANRVLMNEARLQNFYYQIQLEQQMMMQQMMQQAAREKEAQQQAAETSES